MSRDYQVSRKRSFSIHSEWQWAVPGDASFVLVLRILRLKPLRGEGRADRLAFPESPFFEISVLADDSSFGHFCENVFEWLVSEVDWHQDWAQS